MTNKSMIYICSGLTVFAGSLPAEPTCAKCEVIREQNKHRTDYYEYFDDYVKEHPSEAPKHDDSQPAPVPAKPVQSVQPTLPKVDKNI